jgi:hypothetical protein
LKEDDMKHQYTMMNERRASGAPRRRTALWALCGALAMLLASGTAHAVAAYSYKISVVASFPTGTAGKTLAATQPVNTRLTPCSTGKIDAITFTLTYDAGKVLADLKDVYLILYNPDNASPYYTIKRSLFGAGPVLTARATPAALTAAAATDIYVKVADNPGSGSITETVLGGYINLDSVTTGTWQMIGIIADNASVNFDDPTTWTAWDVATVIFGKPWKGASGTACTSIVP